MTSFLGDTQAKAKSFWERKEGTTGMAILAALGVGTYFALPSLIQFVQRLNQLAGELAVLGFFGFVLFAMGYIAFDPKMRIVITLMFKSVSRKLTHLWTTIDPIGIMKNYIDYLNKKKIEMAEGRTKLRGQIKILEGKIQEADGKYNNAMAMTKEARDRGINTQVRVHSKQAGRMEKLSRETLQPLHSKLVVHLRALDKMIEVTDGIVEDTKNEVEAKTIEREAITESYSVLMAAKKILNGGSDERELFDQTMEYVAEDLGMKVGAIEDFLETSKGFIDGLDMQNSVYQADALKKLEEWEAKADDVLLGGTKQRLLESDLTSGPIVTSIGVPATGVVDYAELLRKPR